jgi:hypothetical protein
MAPTIAKTRRRRNRLRAKQSRAGIRGRQVAGAKPVDRMLST